MIAFNVLFTFVCFFMAYAVYMVYIRKFLSDKEKFKLYAIRDKLNIMAMAKKIDYKSEEYCFIIRQINLGIHLFDADISITNTISTFAEESEPAKIKLFKKVLRAAKSNQELNNILSEYYFLINRKIKKELSLAMHLMKVLIVVFQSARYVIKLLTHKKTHFASYYAIEAQIEDINNYKNKVLNTAISKLAIQNA